MKRPPKPKAKTLSLNLAEETSDDLWMQVGQRRKLRPIVDSVYGQVGSRTGYQSLHILL